MEFRLQAAKRQRSAAESRLKAELQTKKTSKGQIKKIQQVKIMTIALLIVGGLIALFFIVLLIMGLPDIMRYIRISKM